MTALPAGPYVAELPRDDRPPAGYQTAEDHLNDALQHTAPALSRHIASKLSKQRTLELADAVRRAVALAVRHHADDIAAAELDAAAELYRQRLAAEPAPEPRSYRCDECGDEFPVDPDDPMAAHGAYLDHQDVHDTDDTEPQSWPITPDEDDHR